MSRNPVIRAAALLGLALAALLVAGCAGGLGVGRPNTIAVAGYGDAHGAPDLAYVDLGVEASDADAGQAVAQASAVMDEVLAALAEQGVAPQDIQTSGLNLWREEIHSDFEGQTDIEVRYRTQNMVNVAVRDVDNIGAVIEAGLDAGATQVLGVRFTIEDTTELEQQAREAAYADAQSRASELARAAGFTLGSPISVSEGYFGEPSPFAAERALGLGGGGGAPPVSPGELTVSVQVNAVYRVR